MTGPALTQRFVMHMRLGKGGFVYLHHIFDGKDLVGIRTEFAETRSGPITTTYALGDRTFDTAAEFVAAYAAQKKAHAA